MSYHATVASLEERWPDVVRSSGYNPDEDFMGDIQRECNGEWWVDESFTLVRARSIFDNRFLKPGDSVEGLYLCTASIADALIHYRRWGFIR